jgi:multicomponent Na+:H+ antiporter subunit A
MVVVYASAYIPSHLAHHERGLDEAPRFFGFLLLFLAAMVGLVMAQDVILIFVFWDLTAIASFFLIGYDRENDNSRSAAMMALLITGGSAVLVLVGFLMLQHELGTFSLPAMIDRQPQSSASGLAAALISVGALAKAAQVPLHFWLPRAMAAPTPVSAYLHSAAMVAAGVFLIGRCYPLIALHGWLLDGFLIVGFTSIVVGGILALTRDVLKQVLAYSTISQYGYVVFMFGFGGEKGVAGATFYVVAHALVKSALFMTAGAVTEATGSTRLSELGGLARAMPGLALWSGCAAAGLIALPLTAGFFKDELLFAAAHARGDLFPVLAVTAAALSFAYIARFWLRLFLGPLKTVPAAISMRLIAPVAVLGVATVLLGVWVAPLARLAERAASISAGTSLHIEAAYHLDLRAENVMALATYAAGIGLLVSERLWQPAALGVAHLGARIGPERLYFSSLSTLDAISNALHRIEVRDLRSRISTILLPAGALVILAVIVTPNSDEFAIGAMGQEDIPITMMLLVTAVAAISISIPRDHLQIVLLTSCVGFGLAAIYAFMGAPDVALVAVLVETILSLFFIGMLLLMPRAILRYETRVDAERNKVRRDAVLGVVSAISAFFVVWGTLSRPAPSTELIDGYEVLTPLAHGKDIVTVILTDFRGFDTLGEICVITMVLLGVLSLIRRGRLR